MCIIFPLDTKTHLPFRKFPSRPCQGNLWEGYTAKQRGNGLLWRVVILQEEFMPDTKDYANTIMFNFNHACTDGVSFCKVLQAIS